MDSQDQSDIRLERIADDYRRTRNVILIVLALSLVMQAYIWWIVIGPERPGTALMEFVSAAAVGETALCPGETLTYEITMRVNGPGVFHLDVSVWQFEPPQMILYSTDTRTLVFPGATEYTLQRAWTVPQTILDPSWNLPLSWLPGQYERRHAISTTSRSTEPSIISIPFQIRQGCP